MSDLFGDPILFIPVIAILAIFSAFYVTAMIWSYNRDAKKQGKKSGCLPVIFFTALIFPPSLFFSGCGETPSPSTPAPSTPEQPASRMTEQEVLSTATIALRAAFPDCFESNRPYKAKLQDGIWQVFGTLPEGPDFRMLGGTPEAKIRDADGEIISIYHTQ
jgi:NTF2 fold immunity protein of polymorphic toxin system component